MKKYFIIFFIFFFSQTFSQEKRILFNYSYQFPIGELANVFGSNSSIGVLYLQNKNTLLYGIEASFIFGNNVKYDDLFGSIATEDGYLINSSGELDEILLYERGFNTHLLLGQSFHFQKDNPTGIYLYGGLGYLEYKIRLESDRTDLPQLDEDYIKGYDNFTNGISSKVCVDYMYFDQKTFIKFYIGTELIYAFTKNKRPYNFGLMQQNSSTTRKDQLFGMHFGVIIPINRNNESKFYHR